ncbi:MAG: hypothetical protein WKF66_20670 [Pedobacter sp.]
MKYVDPIYFHGTSVVAGYTIADVKKKAKDHAIRLITRLSELKIDDIEDVFVQ